MSGPLQGVKIVTSPANPQVKYLAALRTRDRREDADLFLAEGARMVRQALECGRAPRVLGYEDGMRHDPMVGELIRATLSARGEVLELTPSLIGKITRRNNPQSVIAAFEHVVKPLAEIAPKKTRAVLGLDRIKDPGNLGTILRTADAAGADVLIIGDSCDPHGTEAVRASAGSIFAVNIYEGSEADVIALCKSWPGDILGTSVVQSSDYRTVKPKSPSLLLMGNEQYGLSDELSAACIGMVHIPTSDRVESLNVGIAAGILLFTLFPPEKA
ncbi:RNA methyltransferase [Terrihabitans soli]|uniref:RNA methyltransferase n=1 Tax=Terrihabitans soli TaxID=708113 RepID=A0A6S6QSJ1_9HYPH|nr:RNA methyltransferase [Terrihabitans soli]BCJ90242.1 RNA methyltransferase [Terrihabitans soli]